MQVAYKSCGHLLGLQPGINDANSNPLGPKGVPNVDDIHIVNKSLEKMLAKSKKGPQKLLVSGLGANLSYENDDLLLDQEIDRDLAGKLVRTAADVSRQSFSHKLPQPHLWSQQNRQPISGSGGGPIAQSVSSSEGSSSKYTKQRRSAGTLNSDAQGKKKRDSSRVKKLMSCIEGDSLLKEIEKSLEQHNKMEQMEFQEEEEDEDGDDFEMMLQQHNPRQQQYEEDRLKVNEFLNISNKRDTLGTERIRVLRRQFQIRDSFSAGVPSFILEKSSKWRGEILVTRPSWLGPKNQACRRPRFQYPRTSERLASEGTAPYWHSNLPWHHQWGLERCSTLPMLLPLSNKDAEKEGRKLKSLNVNSDIDEDNPEEFQMESRNPIASGSSNTAFVKSTLKKLSYSNEGSHHQTSPGKQRVVQANKPAAQRHTALITQQQQFGNKRTSQSQLMQRKKNGLQEPQKGKIQGKAKQAATQQRGRSSEEEGLPLSINGTPRAQSDERKAQITSITVGPAFGSGDAHSRKSKSKEKIQAKNLCRILTNTAAQQSSQKQNRRHSNTSKKQRYGTQPHQQSVGARLGGAPRSKSRLSNHSI